MHLGPSDSGAYDGASARKAGGAAHVACSLVSPLLRAVRARLIYLVASPRSQVVQDAQLRRFLVQQRSERRFGLGCIRFDHVQLLYNAALIFDATFKVLVLPLDVGNRFACLVTHALIKVADCGVD